LSGRVGVKMRGWKEGHLQKRVAAEHYRKDQNAVDTARVRRVEKLTEMHRTQSNLPPRSRSVQAGAASIPPVNKAPPLGRIPTLEAPSTKASSPSQRSSVRAFRMTGDFRSPDHMPPTGPPSRSQSTAPRLPANDRLQPNMPSGPALERVISGIFQGLKDRIEVQYQSPAAAFRAFDEESSGAIEVHQFGKMIDRFNLAVAGIPQKELHKQLFRRTDLDRDGRISWDEFNKFMRRDDKHNTLMLRREDPYQGERGGMSYVERCGWIRTQARTMCE